MTQTTMIEGLVVGYGGRPVAAIGSVELRPDRVTVVLGPNGSGKTTLLKTIAGILPPVAGRIVPGPTPGPGGAVFVHSVSFLFAGHVRKNMLLASRRQEPPARGALAALGVEDLWDAPVAALSHGQRQRVALARALAAGPALLLVDEPEGGMDAEALELWHTAVTRALSAGRPTVVVAAHRPAALEGLPVRTISLNPADRGAAVPFVARLEETGARSAR